MGNKNSRYRHFESLNDKTPVFKPKVANEEPKVLIQSSNPTFRQKDLREGNETPFSNKMIQKHTESKKGVDPVIALQSNKLNFSMAELEVKRNWLRSSTAVTSKINSKVTSPMESYRKEALQKQKY